MNRYRNLSVRTKLLSGFLVMVVISVIIGLVGVLSVGNLRDADEDMYTENTQPMGELASMYDNLASQRICAANMVIFDTENPEFAAEEAVALGEKEALFEAAFQIYHDSIVDDTEMAFYNAMAEMYFGDFVAVKQEVRAAVESDDVARMALAMKSMDDMGAEISGIMDEAFAYNIAEAASKVSGNASLATSSSITLLIVMLLGAVIAIASAIYLSSIISRPLGRIMEATNQVGMTGNLHFETEFMEMINADAKFRDEVGRTAASFGSMMDNLIASSHMLEQVADGDLTVTIEKAGPEDTLGNAIEKMVGGLNEMFSEVNSSTTQVSAGANQIADGAQALAQGATEQAGAVEDLSNTIGQILEQTRENSGSAEQALHIVNKAGSEMESTMQLMEEMQTAMGGISSSSEEISKVIKVIDDIAFQTNILALNAAVEAARAGLHGKGFAVVANEVRNLASKSAEAAKETANLIQTSVEHVKEGGEIATRTRSSVQQVAESARQAQEKIAEINEASQKQEASISDINTGIDQISQVVQANSATAEESAAASEELSSQSQMLTELVSRFKVKSDSALPPAEEVPRLAGENPRLSGASPGLDIPGNSKY